MDSSGWKISGLIVSIFDGFMSSEFRKSVELLQIESLLINGLSNGE